MARIKNDYDFLAGVHINDELYFNKYRLTLDITTNSNVPQDQNLAFDRINYFIYEVVQRSIFVDSINIDAIDKYTAAGIPVLQVPGMDPYDQVVQALIVYKINAIMEDVLTVTVSEISSLVGSHVAYIWDYIDEDDTIHEVINDEDGDNWWSMPTPCMLSATEDEINTSDFQSWEQLNLHWYDEIEDVVIEDIIEDPDPDGKPSQTILKMSDFK